MQIKIRKAEISDLKRIAELQKKQNLLHKKFDPKFYIPAGNYEKKWIKFTKEEMNNQKSFLFIAICRDKIVGFIRGIIQEARLRKVNKYGFIKEIFIEKDYRKKGIGTKLMDKAIKWFKSKKLFYVELSVDSRNKEAIKFYEKLGFKEYEKTLKKDI